MTFEVRSSCDMAEHPKNDNSVNVRNLDHSSYSEIRFKSPRNHLQSSHTLMQHNLPDEIEEKDLEIEIYPMVRTKSHISLKHQPPIITSPIITNQVVKSATSQSFAQRHPTLARLFSGFVAVLVYPVLLAVNLVVTPFLMGAAFFSKACGSGELAKDIGASAIAKALWGETADWMAEGKMESSRIAFSAFVPYAAGIEGISASVNVYSEMLKLLEKGKSAENLNIQSDINEDKTTTKNKREDNAVDAAGNALDCLQMFLELIGSFGKP